MTRILFALLTLFVIHDSQAQYAYFATHGKISFEKITYTRARMRDLMAKMDAGNNAGRGPGGGGMRMGGNLENMPESSTQYFELTFDEKQSLMTAVEEEENSQSGGGPSRRATMGFSGGNRGSRGGMNISMRRMGGNNSKVLYQNLKDQTAEIQVEIDEKYMLSDSLSPITWRFTDEYRTIAGYECRRVNGATPDSLYLIAYYTDQIPVSAGPALSHGLPGMIMGLVIPEMHIHYWATKVTYSNEPVPTNWKDKKVKSMGVNEFSESFGRFFSRGREDNNTSNKKLILEQLIY
ncbi:GLPGLI family protein [Sphingobacterium alkalisoli]|uniref:GLPGLI family protein n=1 Tax=Sphingobacterium alkalisoli TaxID=1874115 RepID=A0A4U0H891_9SPHI|nr:GLPGLI family protein [Sphingobacterium alkalisoli]TJY68095.1 GLPGLI family protein [Sphingobacterium alkalisoli]GGH09093.1 hypothetical protein GCM10011418_06910 [Sphingobacterium alkalisoli]